MINSDNSLPETSQASTAEERVHDITKERHALELRAEVINLVAGKKAERKGLSDRLEIGIESATDTAYGKEELHVGGGLTEEANIAETTGLMLSMTVYGKLNLNYYSDTLITSGGMLEQYTGGEVIAAGMSDNLLGGGGIRIRGADLRMNAASAVEEKVSTLAIDGLVAECCSTACEREEGNAIYSVGFASYKGTMEVLTGTTMRPMCRALFGVRTKNRGGGGGGGDSNEPSPEQSPAAATDSPKPPTDTLLPAGGSPDATMGGLYSTVKTAKNTGRIEDVLGGANNAITAGRSLDAANQLEELQNIDELQEVTNLRKLPEEMLNKNKFIETVDQFRVAYSSDLTDIYADIQKHGGKINVKYKQQIDEVGNKIAAIEKIKESIQESEDVFQGLESALIQTRRADITDPSIGEIRQMISDIALVHNNKKINIIGIATSNPQKAKANYLAQMPINYTNYKITENNKYLTDPKLSKNEIKKYTKIKETLNQELDDLLKVKKIVEESDDPIEALKRAIDIEDARIGSKVETVTLMQGQLNFFEKINDLIKISDEDIAQLHYLDETGSAIDVVAIDGAKTSSDSYLHRVSNIYDIPPGDILSPPPLPASLDGGDYLPPQLLPRLDGDDGLAPPLPVRLVDGADYLDLPLPPRLDGGDGLAPPLPARPQDSAPPLPARPQDSAPPLPARPQDSAPPLPARPQASAPPLPARPQDSAPPLPARPQASAPLVKASNKNNLIDELKNVLKTNKSAQKTPPPRAYDGSAGANAPTIIKNNIADLSAPRQAKKPPIPSKRKVRNFIGNKLIQNNLDIAADQIKITEVNKIPTDSPSQQVRVLQSNDSSSINPTLGKGATQWEAPSDVDTVLRQDPLSFDAKDADIFRDVIKKYVTDINGEIKYSGGDEAYTKLAALDYIDLTVPQPLAKLEEIIGADELPEETLRIYTLVYAEVAEEVTKRGGSLDFPTFLSPADNVASVDNVTAADNVASVNNVTAADNATSNVSKKMAKALKKNKKIIDDSLNKYLKKYMDNLTENLQKQYNATDNLDEKLRIYGISEDIPNVDRTLKRWIDPGSPRPFDKLENAIIDGTVVNTNLLSDTLSSIKKNITNAGGSLDLTPARITNSQDIQRIEEVIPPRYVDNISPLAEDVAHIPTTTPYPQIVFRATPTDPEINTNAITQAKGKIRKENRKIHNDKIYGASKSPTHKQAQQIENTARIQYRALGIIEVENANNPQLFTEIETAISDGILNADEIKIYQNILDRVKGEFQQLGGVDILLQADDIDSSYHHITGAADGPHPTGSIPSTSESTFRRYAGLVVNSPADNSGGFRVQGIIPDSVELSPSALGSLDESTPQLVKDILNAFEGNARNQPINIKIKKSAYGNKPQISLDNLKNAPREPGQQVNWTGNYQQANAVEPISATPAPDLPPRSFINSRPANTNNPTFGYSSTAQLGDNYEELSGLPFYSSQIDPINIDDFVEVPPNSFTSPLHKLS